MYFTTREAAVRADVNERSIRRAIAENRLQAVHNGSHYLIYADALTDFLASRKRHGHKRPSEDPQLEQLLARVAALEHTCADIQRQLQALASPVIPQVAAPELVSNGESLKSFLRKHDIPRMRWDYYASVCNAGYDEPLTQEQIRMIVDHWMRTKAIYRRCDECPH